MYSGQLQIGDIVQMNDRARGQLSGLAGRLVADGLISAQQAEEAQKQAPLEQMQFVQYLVEKVGVSGVRLAETASHEFGVPLFDISALNASVIPDGLVDVDLTADARLRAARRELGPGVRDDIALDGRGVPATASAVSRQVVDALAELGDVVLVHAEIVARSGREITTGYGEYVRRRDRGAHLRVCFFGADIAHEGTER